MDLVPVTEGATTVLVPAPDPDAAFPPGTAPVFYNPRMALNRDATVLFLRALLAAGFVAIGSEVLLRPLPH